jgi:hypothetical protein
MEPFMIPPKTRHRTRSTKLTTFATVVAAGAALSGCQSKPPPTSVSPDDQLQARKQPVAQPDSKAPGAPESEIGSAQALTVKTEAWAREMEGLMGKRPVVRPGAVGEPSVVDFMDPEQFTLGLPARSGRSRKSDGPVTIIPISDPVLQATPSDANRGAALTTPAADDKVRTAVATNTKLPPMLADGALDKAVASPASARDKSPSAGDLELSLSRQLSSNANELWPHLDFQLLQFLKDKPTPQLDVMTKLSTEDRELIASVMDGLTNFRNALRADNNMLMSRKVKPLLEMADRVRAQADLTIPAVALCTKVDGFGVYEPIEPARFTAMKEHAVIVYCEVENFASQQTEKKLWETRLSQEVVLYTETGLPVWQDKTETIPDFARRRRHDFFIVKKTKLPGNVAIGRYLLKVTIVDQQASRVAEATIPVQFVAQ